ncbi:hypothetical protein QUA35_24350 [Microcoleus sp. N9_B2]|uniref:hypothetical protein n=1 Tax=unclassified Microcoleus TaxID=2642155 RepID=UPI002FD14A95
MTADTGRLTQINADELDGFRLIAPSVIVDPSASLMAALLTEFYYSDATGIDINTDFLGELLLATFCLN